MTTRPELSLALYGIEASHYVPLARLAEREGLRRVWIGEHLVSPTEYTSRGARPDKLVVNDAVPESSLFEDDGLGLRVAHETRRHEFIRTR